MGVGRLRPFVSADAPDAEVDACGLAEEASGAEDDDEMASAEAAEDSTSCMRWSPAAGEGGTAVPSTSARSFGDVRYSSQ